MTEIVSKNIGAQTMISESKVYTVPLIAFNIDMVENGVLASSDNLK
jgi:ABC-type uncharacterized transport system substrate-binding protein